MNEIGSFCNRFWVVKIGKRIEKRCKKEVLSKPNDDLIEKNLLQANLVGVNVQIFKKTR